MNLREKCIRCAIENTPDNVTLVRVVNGEYGRAIYTRDGEWVGELVSPIPHTPDSLFIFLHECGHFQLGHWKRKPEYIKEYEAEQYAISVMKRYGIPIPRRCISLAKLNVRDRVQLAKSHGLRRVKSKVRKWLATVTDG